MTLRKFLKILKWFFIILILVLVAAYVAIHFTPVQNWIVKKVADNLSEKLHTKVQVKHVEFDLFNKMHIQGILVEDLKKDTLLYAGEAKVNITDWFFFKDHATLHYVSLKDTRINLKRTDTTWNYQFIADYFGGGKKSGSSKKGIEFDFKEVGVENILINQKDEWIGKDLQVVIGKGKIDANAIDFNNKKIDIDKIQLTEPMFTEYRYTGNKRKTNYVPPPSIPDTTVKQFQWNNDGWVVKVNELDIENGKLKIERDTERKRFVGRFDGAHLLFEKLNGSFKNLLFEKDTLSAKVLLASKEQSGFEVKKLEADLKFTPSLMEFANLDLVTNRSHLKNYYSMSYSDFSGDFGDYIHAVKMDGRFTGTRIDSEDLAFFAPKAEEWKRTFLVNGTASGTVDNLRAGNMLITSGSTTLDGSLVMRGLPDINETFIDFKSNKLQTNHADVSVFVPTLNKVDHLKKLGTINFKGNFTGFINDFVTYGTTQTNLGTVTTDVNMKLPEGGSPQYSGKINTAGFNLGKLLGNTELGNIAVDGKIKGSGFTLKDLKASFDGTAKKFYLSGYEYQNVVVNGNFEKDIFNGKLNVDDPNLVVKNLDGTITLSGDKPQYRFNALLQKARLKNLKLTNEEFTLDGTFNLNFSGNHIDNFQGTAKVYDASLHSKDRQLSFNYLSLESLLKKDGTKELTFETNELNGNIAGKFKIAELPDAFKLFLNKYYPTYVKKPRKKVSQQDFTFNIKTNNIEGYAQLLDKKLKGFDNSNISGSLQLSTNTLSVDADVPGFSYDGKEFSGILLKSSGTLDSLATDISVNEISISDSLKFPSTKLSVHTRNDSSHVSITTSASKTLNQASLNAMVTTLPDGVSIDFEPSSFILNENKWELEKQGNLTIRKKNVNANEIKFVNGQQEIVVSTRLPGDEGYEPELVANLKKVHIDDFTTMLFSKPKLEGNLTGEVVVSNIFSKPSATFSGDAEKFVLDGNEIGDTKVNAAYNSAIGELVVDTKTTGEKNTFAVKGRYLVNDSSDNQMNFDMIAEKFDLSTIEPYLSGIFSDLNGNVKSTVKLSGNNKKQYLTGVVTADSASLKVIYTQCRYKLIQPVIRFNKDELDFGTLTLKDELGNTASASGVLEHHLFKDFNFKNISFKVNTPASEIPGTGKFLVLNTTRKDNSAFYGRVIGDATTSMNLNGPITNMIMDIDGAPSKTDSSYIRLLTGQGREGGKIDYIDFVPFGNKMEDVFSASKSTNILVNLKMQANPSCKIDVVLDEETGDIISGEGNGNLNIRVGNKENITMNGVYNITKGFYRFNLQTVVDKGFQINRGYINWSGDPYNAMINIDATYTAPKVDLKLLSSSSGSLAQTSDVDVVAHLTEQLKSPKISFEFKLPPQSEPAKDPIVLENLRQFQQDPTEMNKQVFAILMFNQFFSNNEIKNSLPSFLGGTVGNMVSNYLNAFLTKQLKQYAPLISFNTGYNAEYGLTTADLLKAIQASGSFTWKKALLDGRLVVGFGGNFDINNPYIFAVRNTNVTVTPDITVEWLLTKDGSWRLVGFNRTNIDQTYGQRNKTGVKISHHVEFDKPRKPKVKK